MQNAQETKENAIRQVSAPAVKPLNANTTDSTNRDQDQNQDISGKAA